jgi:hypothetical protein
MKVGLFVTLEWEAAHDDGQHHPNMLQQVKAAKAPRNESPVHPAVPPIAAATSQEP